MAKNASFYYPNRGTSKAACHNQRFARTINASTHHGLGLRVHVSGFAMRLPRPEPVFGE